MKLDIWTDGSCWQGVGAWAYVLVVNRKGHDHTIAASGAIDGTTSNRCEMLGVIMALERLEEGLFNPTEVVIYSDSQYTCNMLGGVWKLKPSTKNRDLIERYQKLELSLNERGMKFKFQWVRGHNGTKYNELADKLCGTERELLWSSVKESKIQK